MTSESYGEVEVKKVAKTLDKTPNLAI